MAANNLGTAYIKIAPQMEGIQSSISNAISSAASSSSVKTSTVALGNVVSSAITTAVSAIRSSLDTAIKRTDIINNFSKVMSNMGISVDESQKSIDQLVKKLDGLPTALQDGASAVQRFTSKNGDIQKSTDIFLALNNAILAGAAPAELQATAIEQISQAYAKGKPDMMEWRSMMSAMPAQLNQIAKKMGFGANSADKLGEALRKGEVSMDDFMGAIIELNTKGSDGFLSFEEQARNSTDGIGTAMTNVRNRIAAAIQKIINAFGSRDIAEAINKFSSSFGGIADWIGENIVPIIKNNLIPVLKTMLGVVKNVIEFIAQNKWVQNTLMGILNVLLAYKAVTAVKTAITGIIAPVVSLASNLGSAVSAFSAARAAGLTFSTAMGAAASSSKGLVSTVASATSSLGSFKTAAGSLATTLETVGAASAIVASAIWSIQGIQAAAEMEQVRHNTALRDYYNHLHNDVGAVYQLKRAMEDEKRILDDLNEAMSGQNDAEIAYLEAKKYAASLQDDYNRLLKDGTASTEDLRLAQLKLDKANDEATEKQKALNDAINATTAAQNEYVFNQTAGIYNSNKLAIQEELLRGEYAKVAAQLDGLVNSTITYTDTSGNLAYATKEQATQMASGLSNAVASLSDSWGQINELVNNEGLTYTEACKRVGQEAGSGIADQFALGVQTYTPLITDAVNNTKATVVEQLQEVPAWFKELGEKTDLNLAEGILGKDYVPTQSLVEAIKKSLQKGSEATAGSNEVGSQIVAGINAGVETKKSGLYRSLADVVRTAIDRMKAAAQIHSPSKATAEIGKFMMLGLAGGIEDYTEDAVVAAREAAQATIGAFNGNTALGATPAQISPYNSANTLGGAGGQVTQYNTFNQVDSNLDMDEISKRLGWQVAIAI